MISTAYFLYIGTALSKVPRPSHADYTYRVKYGTAASSGGGRASARETIGRVASGAIAEKWLKQKFGIEIVAWVSSVGDIELPKNSVDVNTITREQVDASLVRCPDLEVSNKMSDVRSYQLTNTMHLFNLLSNTAHITT